MLPTISDHNNINIFKLSLLMFTTFIFFFMLFNHMLSDHNNINIVKVNPSDIHMLNLSMDPIIVCIRNCGVPTHSSMPPLYAQEISYPYTEASLFIYTVYMQEILIVYPYTLFYLLLTGKK